MDNILSIIIPTHRPGPALNELLDSIAAQKELSNYEVLVVANPPNATLEISLKERQNAIYLSSEKLGSNSARNLGLKEARGEIVLFLDDDCFLTDPYFLSKHIQFHKANPGFTGIGGTYSAPIKLNGVSCAYHEAQLHWLAFGLCPGYQADLLLGGNMSFKRAMLREERFNEALVFGGTETEFIFRLAASGHNIRRIEELCVEHRLHINIVSLCSKAFLQGKGAAYIDRTKSQKTPMVAPYSSLKNLEYKRSFYSKIYNLLFSIGFAYEMHYPGRRVVYWKILKCALVQIYKELISYRDIVLRRLSVAIEAADLFRK